MNEIKVKVDRVINGFQFLADFAGLLAAAALGFLTQEAVRDMSLMVQQEWLSWSIVSVVLLIPLGINALSYAREKRKTCKEFLLIAGAGATVIVGSSVQYERSGMDFIYYNPRSLFLIAGFYGLLTVYNAWDFLSSFYEMKLVSAPVEQEKAVQNGNGQAEELTYAQALSLAKEGNQEVAIMIREAIRQAGRGFKPTLEILGVSEKAMHTLWNPGTSPAALVDLMKSFPDSFADKLKDVLTVSPASAGEKEKRQPEAHEVLPDQSAGGNGNGHMVGSTERWANRLMNSAEDVFEYISFYRYPEQNAVLTGLKGHNEMVTRFRAIGSKKRYADQLASFKAIMDEKPGRAFVQDFLIALAHTPKSSAIRLVQGVPQEWAMRNICGLLDNYKDLALSELAKNRFVEAEVQKLYSDQAQVVADIIIEVSERGASGVRNLAEVFHQLNLAHQAAIAQEQASEVAEPA